MRIRLKWDDGRQDPDLLFRGIPEKGLWASFSFSTVAQAAVVWIGVSYLHFLTTLPPDALAEARRDRVLDLSSDPAPYHPLPQPQSPVEHSAGGAPAPSRPAAPRRPSESGSGFHETITAPSLPAREFRMPPAQAAHPVTQTLVQMDLPPTMDLHPQLRVPTIVLLASVPHRVAPKPFVAPPPRKTTMEVPGKVALEMRPPVLDVRAGYAKTPDVLSAATPKLAAPVGAVAPVASNREPVEAKPTAATVTGNTPAEPANIISLPDRPIPAASAIVLPPLNQVSGRDAASGTAGPMDPSGGEGVSGKSTPELKPGGAGATPSHSGTGGTTATNAVGNSSGNHLPSAGTGTDHDGNAAGVAPGNGTKPGIGTKPGAGTSGSGGTASGVAGPTRLIRPQNGAYEVAIVQSSGVVPGSNGMLRGKPVYSVYIPVGTGKEWILQYCMPADDARPAPRSQVVQLGTITPVTAPYAFSIVGPAIQFRAGARYAFIHGFVNVSGHFEHLEEASDKEIENIGPVLESLAQWEFRPAMKDGAPAVVEILLCIPNAA